VGAYIKEQNSKSYSWYSICNSLSIDRSTQHQVAFIFFTIGEDTERIGFISVIDDKATREELQCLDIQPNCRAYINFSTLTFGRVESRNRNHHIQRLAFLHPLRLLSLHYPFNCLLLFLVLIITSFSSSVVQSWLSI